MTDPPTSVASLLANPDPEARRLGAQNLPIVEGPLAVDLLARALGDTDWRVRKEAATVASSVNPRADVLGRLLETLNDHENVGLRNAAVEALIAIGADAVPYAVRALAELDADGRKLAAEVLAGVPHVDGTRALIGALADPDVNVRAAAAEALGAARMAGEESQALAIEALTATLTGGDPLGRLAALCSLTRLEAKLSWKVFEPLTNDPLLRRHAIAAGGFTHEAAAIGALARATGDRSAAVARDALIALVDCLSGAHGDEDLGRIARSELRKLPVAEARIRTFAGLTEDSRLRGAALVALGLLRTSSDVPALVLGLSDEDVAERAELGLRWFGREAVPSLLVEGVRSSAPVRAATLAIVPLLTERADRTTLDALRDALASPASEVLVAALQAIALAGSGADLTVMAPFATHADTRVAATACLALSSLAARHTSEARSLATRIAPDAAHAIVGCLLRGASAASAARQVGGSATEAADLAFLRATLDHVDVRVRRATIDALAAIGGPKAAEIVARGLADEERDVVLASVRALGRVGHAAPLLALLADVRDPTVVAAALRAMAEANPSQAFDAAWSLLDSKDPLLASSAVEAIGRLRGARRDEGLFVALGHADPDVVKSALVELSRDVSPRTIERIGVCLDHGSYDVRRFAAEVLGAEENTEAEALLRGRLAIETDPLVREALTLALSPRGGRDGA